MRYGPNIQWDGKYLAVADPYGTNQSRKPAKIYEVQVSGSSATIVKTIKLVAGKGIKNRNPGGGVQFWIQGSTIVNPMSPKANLDVWKYPAGGSPIDFIALAWPVNGVTVSLAPSR